MPDLPTRLARAPSPPGAHRPTDSCLLSLAHEQGQTGNRRPETGSLVPRVPYLLTDCGSKPPGTRRLTGPRGTSGAARKFADGPLLFPLGGQPCLKLHSLLIIPLPPFPLPLKPFPLQQLLCNCCMGHCRIREPFHEANVTFKSTWLTSVVWQTHKGTTGVHTDEPRLRTPAGGDNEPTRAGLWQKLLQIHSDRGLSSLHNYWRRAEHHSHFTDGEAEAQRAEATCPRSPQLVMGKPEPRLARSLLVS